MNKDILKNHNCSVKLDGKLILVTYDDYTFGVYPSFDPNTNAIVDTQLICKSSPEKTRICTNGLCTHDLARIMNLLTDGVELSEDDICLCVEPIYNIL